MFFASFIIPFVVIVIYAVFIRSMESRWNKIPAHSVPSGYVPKQRITVLIPFRNEMPNLMLLLDDLQKINYPHSLTDFVFIDDHSEDTGASLVQQYVEKDHRFRLLSLSDKNGKKAALQLGLEQSDSDLVVTTDADCRISSQWLMQFSTFHLLEEPVMILAPVLIAPKKGFFGRLLLVEWLSIAGLTGASASRQKALMANGAGICVERKALEHLEGFSSHAHISSGDDMFLLAQLKRWGLNTVKYIWSKDAIVTTSAPSSARQLLSQRLRWASKTRQIKDRHIMRAGTIILLSNLGILFLAATCWFSEWHLYSFFLSFGIKIIADHSFISAVAKKFDVVFREKEVIILSFFYPVYILFIPLVGLFYKPSWKGRKVTT